MALSVRKLPGYTGKEGCVGCGSPNGSRHYGQELTLEGIHAFTGWRGPYCSARCYRANYPDEIDNLQISSES